MKKLWAFDFDDTLARTDSKVYVVNGDQRFELKPGQFSVYDTRPGDIFDYTDFETLVNPRTIKWTNRILKAVYAHHDPENIVVVSARGYPGPICEFLTSHGLDGIEVVALGTSDPLSKLKWIEERVSRDGYEEVEFLDDSPKNIAAVRRLTTARVIARRIDYRKIASLFDA